MLTIILGATGHGKMQYGLTQTVEKSHGKKVLIISNELSPAHILQRLAPILKYNNVISPIEITITPTLDYSDLSFASGYDVVSILSYIHAPSQDNHQATMEVFQASLKKLNTDFPEKEIMATIQLARPLECSFNKIKDEFFKSQVETNNEEKTFLLETSDTYNYVLIYRNPESERFQILNHRTKEIKSISKFDFFCES
jgi:hypothetical protein